MAAGNRYGIAVVADGQDEAPVFWRQDTSAAQLADDSHTLPS